MGLRLTNQYGLTPMQKFSIDQGIPTGMFEQFADAPAVEVPGYLRTVNLATRKYTVFGAGVEAIGLSFAGSYLSDLTNVDLGRVDPDFNPFDTLEIPGWLDRHPWMEEDFKSGEVLNYTNDEAFQLYVTRQGIDWDERQELSNAGFLQQLLAAAPGQVVEGVLAGGMVRAIGLGGKTARIGMWAKRGNLGKRVLASGILGLGLNTGQELGLIAINPNRLTDNKSELILAAGMGLLFGSAVPMIAAGGRSVQTRVSSRKISRMQTKLGEFFSDPAIRTDVDAVDDAVRQGISEMREALDRTVTERRDIPVDRPGRSPLDVGEDARLGVQTFPDQRPLVPTVKEPLSLSIIDTPETRPLVRALKEKYGDAVIFRPYDEGLQNAAVFLGEMNELQVGLETLRPENATRAAKLAQPYVSLLGMVTPGSKLRNSPALLSRMALHLLGTDSVVTGESLRRPLTHSIRPSAESIQMNLDTLTAQFVTDVDDAFLGLRKAKKHMRYTYANGDTVEIGGILDRSKFRRAVMDHLYQTEAARGVEPPAPAPIKQAAASYREYMSTMGTEAHGVRLLETFDPERFHLPHRWVARNIRADKDGFIQRLVAQTRQNRLIDFRTGTPIVADERLLIDAVIKALSNDDVAAIRLARGKAPLKELSEGWLRANVGDASLQRYLAEIDHWNIGRAQASFETLTGAGAAHGVDAGMSEGSVFKSRLLEVDPTNFTQFLEDDIGGLIDAYHRQASGRIAMRRALQLGQEEWAPVIKSLTGKDLAAEGWNPALVEDAIKADFQRWQNLAARKGDPKLSKLMEANRDRVLRIFKGKLDELQGTVDDNPGFVKGIGTFAGRAAMKLTFMAQLGRVSISQIPDIAALSVYKHLNVPKLRALKRVLSLIPQSGTPRQMQSLFVAVSDGLNNTRAQSLGLIDTTTKQPYGPSALGRGASFLDRMGDKAVNRFVRMTGMSWWNRVLKTYAASLQTQDLLVGARKMVKAADDIAALRARAAVTPDIPGKTTVRVDIDEAAILAKHGLRPEDASRLNRLGLNADRSQRLLDHLFENGTDWNGTRPWAGDRAAFDSVDDAIFPDFQGLRAADREMFEIFTQAVNMETTNIIVEPHLMSKPLMNQRLIGKMFNQFQMFGIAWGSQLAPIAGAQRGTRQAAFMMRLVGLGAISDALHNSLSGRRSIEETLEMWKTNKLAMTYAAVDRSGFTGWLARPLQWANQTRLGPEKVLDEEASSSQYYQNIGWAGVLGPSADYTERLARNFQRTINHPERMDARAWHQWRRTLIGNNLIQFSLFQRATEAMNVKNPFGPGKGIDPFITGPANEDRQRKRRRR